MFPVAKSFVKRPTQIGLTGAGLAVVALVGLIDRFTPPQMLFSIFYLPAIVVVTWLAGRIPGMIVAAASTLAWLIVNERQGLTPAFVPYWNAATGGLVFLAVVFLLAALKSLTIQLEQRVAARTEELSQAEQRFRQMAEGINDVFYMMDLDRSQVIYVNPAYEQIWGRTCASFYQQPDSKMAAVHPEDRFRISTTTSGADVEYRITRPTGGVRWIHERTYPIDNESGVAYRLAGIAEDITGRKSLERKILAVTDEEQGRIGRDIHDGLCQHLTATLLATRLLQAVLTGLQAPEAAPAGQIADFLEGAIRQARAVARGLDPVKVESNGLLSALEELAATVQNLDRIRCDFQTDERVRITDHVAAVQLYRIAQEAVTNALKHSRAKRIELTLHRELDWLELTIRDDGIGISEPLPAGAGMGLQTLRYRASLIGAKLEIQRINNGGTQVCCTVPYQTVGK